MSKRYIELSVAIDGQILEKILEKYPSGFFTGEKLITTTIVPDNVAVLHQHNIAQS